MAHGPTTWTTAAALCALAATTGFARQDKPTRIEPGSKEAVHARLGALAGEIESLRARGLAGGALDRLLAEYDALSASLGGDQPVARGPRPAHGSAGGPQAAVTPLCIGSTPTTANFSGTTGAIPDASLPSATFVAVVSGAGTYLWSVDLSTLITHTNCADLDITLQSPAGTLVTLTTDNGGTNDNVFNGTIWSESVNDSATDHVYANMTLASPLCAEGRLSAFRGEDPNGTWLLRVADDTLNNTGALSAWSLNVWTLAAAPSESTTAFSRSPGLAIPDQSGTTPGVATDTLTVSGLGTYISSVAVYTGITHTYPGDLEIRLTSPAGTTVALGTRNGGGNDNVFNGTRWDGECTLAVTDYVFADSVVAPLLGPESALASLVGQDPNGVWTLQIKDMSFGDTGALARWDVIVTTSSAQTPAFASFGGTSGPIPDYAPAGANPVSFTATVSGQNAYLWDLDLTTALVHTSSGDIDMTLQSPAGTLVVISSDNGGTLDNVFDGTLWDDSSVAAVNDYVYTNGSVAPTLAPEGRLSAFRGENPNGLWTLTIGDDTLNDVGALNAWSLGVTTLLVPSSGSTAVFSRWPAILINDLSTIADAMSVSGLPPALLELKVYLDVLHTYNADLDIKLTSPAGTTIPISTDNGGGYDNVFNGTLFDPRVADAVSEHVYVNLQAVPLLGPEGAFDAFAGQDPNGLWTLTITDDAGGDVGQFIRWDLQITTCGSPAPVSYCTAGTTSNGCAAHVSASANPSLTTAQCVIQVTGVEGVQSGVLFYGLSPNALSWGAGSNSFFCVKVPVARASVQNSGGTYGTCSGAYSLDWDAFQAANPGLLGQPWTAGSRACVQAWFRDPPAPKTTNLSDALELIYLP